MLTVLHILLIGVNITKTLLFVSKICCSLVDILLVFTHIIRRFRYYRAHFYTTWLSH